MKITLNIPNKYVQERTADWYQKFKCFFRHMSYFSLKYWVFCLFRCLLGFFFNLKTAINSSEKPTGQQICAMLGVSNILIHEVCRKFDKNCTKILKIGKLWDFCLFRCQFEILFNLKIAIISS